MGVRQPRQGRSAEQLEDQLHRHPRHRDQLREHAAPGAEPPLRVVAVHAALQRRAHRAAREAQGCGLAGRQLVRQHPLDRPGARGLRRPGHLVHRGDVPHLGEAGALPGREVRHPTGPLPHHRARQRPGDHPGAGAADALGPGPVLGLGALLRSAGRPVPADRHGAQQDGDDSGRTTLPTSPRSSAATRRRRASRARRAAPPR
jgi:hypothetical protein